MNLADGMLTVELEADTFVGCTVRVKLLSQLDLRANMTYFSRSSQIRSLFAVPRQV